MFIGENNYPTDNSMVGLYELRYLLHKGIYNDIENLQILIDAISKYIECINIEFDPSFMTIVAKIKKTGLRKTYGRDFSHNPYFYYQFIPDIFYDFLIHNHSIRNKLIELLGEKYEDPYIQMDHIANCKTMFANLCIVSCMSDNIIIFRL